MKYVVSLNGKDYEVEVEKTDAVIVGIKETKVTAPATPITAPIAVAVSAAPAVVAAPAVAAPAVAAPAVAAPVAAEGTNIESPMPGTILEVNISAGQAVKAGDVLMILEAMKMENDIVAPADGVIKQVLVSKGSTVNTDDILAVL